MDESNNKQPMTLDDLAAMVARGFEDITGRMATKDGIANMATKDDIAAIRAEMATKDDLAATEQRLKTEIEGLRNSVNNYLNLSNERYLELKHRQDVIVSWVAKIAEKNNVHIDLTELEYK